MPKDYIVGKSYYCGDCTHSATKHEKNGCVGTETRDFCDCTRSAQDVKSGALASGIVRDKVALVKRRTDAQWGKNGVE